MDRPDRPASRPSGEGAPSRTGSAGKGAQRCLKAVFDVVAAAAALAVLSPVLAVVSLLILASAGRHVFFRQERPGYRGRLFGVLKFRTMTDERDAAGNLLPDRDRLTRVGRFVRSTSLDELPQLINVLRREMSLVGPRPQLRRYLDRYSAEHARRHDVMPGITGWAQIHGRHRSTLGQRLDMDVWYVDNWSFLLDLEIIGRTFVQVLRREGYEEQQHRALEIDDIGITDAYRKAQAERKRRAPEPARETEPPADAE